MILNDLRIETGEIDIIEDSVLHNDWHVVARSQDLQPGKVLKARLLGEDLVLWRCGEQAIAWQDRCPHRGSSFALGWIENNSLVCPYHGLTYNSEGECVHIPTTPDLSPPAWACVKTYQTQERYDLVWVCLGKPEHHIPPLPEWDDPNYRRFPARSFYCHASVFRMVENFFDFTHVHFVHKGLMGDPKSAAVDNHEVRLAPNGMFIGEDNKIKYRQSILETRGDGAESIRSFHLCRPLTVYFRRGPESQRMVIIVTATPVDEEECNYWVVVLMNYNYEMPEDEMAAYIDKIHNQDVAIVEGQRPRRLPLNLPIENHLPHDKSTIVYRKWLKQLGITYGTI